MRRIPLTKGKVAWCDDADYPLLSRYSWHAARNQHGQWYAVTSLPDPLTGGQFQVKMHQMLMGCRRRMLPDHKNGDGLDNRRENLRWSTGPQNQWNTGPRRGSSRFKGVAWVKSKRKWRAALMANGKTHFGGYFEDELEAARRFNAQARRLHGPFARLNPEEQAYT